MASVNKVILVGNLGKDPESRYMQNGDAVCNIIVAMTETWKDKSTGEKKENVEWHRVVFRRKLAEIAGQVQEFYQEMDAADIPAGSTRALRLFS